MSIRSILDNDLYKFTQQNAVLHNFHNTKVVYEFKDRNPKGLYNDAFLKGFNQEVERMSNLRLTDDQLYYIENKLSFLNRKDYLSFLSSYRFDPNEVKASVENGNLNLNIGGNWENAILWEVPLLATISEQYFLHCDTQWNMNGQLEKARYKSNRLSNSNCTYADFGTRRRRNYETQELFVKESLNKRGFVGTSNVHIAKKFGIKALGTMAHEWIMGVSALDGLRHANRDALNRWCETYQGNLGTALTDTYGSEAFFDDFDGKLARLYDGVRHDSGSPFAFGDKVIKHYQKLGIKPLSKTIIFSDGLDVDLAIEIKDYFKEKIGVSFGIGTHFTNDFENSKALKIVIKLKYVNGIPVVKLSDDNGKIQGDTDACRVAKWTFFGTPLDQIDE